MAARRGAAGTRAINPRVRGGARGQRTSLRQERFSISGAIGNLPNKVVDQENGHLLPVLVHLIVLDVRQHLHTSRLSLSRKHEAHSCGSVLSSNLVYAATPPLLRRWRQSGWRRSWSQLACPRRIWYRLTQLQSLVLWHSGFWPQNLISYTVL